MDASFFQAARKGNNSLGLFFVTLGLLILAFFVGQAPLTYYLVQEPGTLDANQGFNPVDLGLSPAYGLFLVTFPFILGLLVLLGGVQLLHKRPWTSLIRGFQKPNWYKYWLAFGAWFLICAVGELVMWALHPEAYHLSFQPNLFFPVLLVAFFVLPLQTSLEELLFRGYLLQGITISSQKPWLALAVTSLLFGLLHGTNPEVQAIGPIALSYYIGVGAFLGLLTLLDQGTELALGLHAANNVFGATMVSFPSSAFQMPTIFRSDEFDFPLMMAVWVVMAGAFFLLSKRMFGANWNWKSLLSFEVNDEEMM